MTGSREHPARPSHEPDDGNASEGASQVIPVSGGPERARVLQLREPTPADRAFLWEVHRTALRDAVEATWGWDEAFQARYFAERFATRDRFVVCIDGVAAGVLHFIVRADHVFLSTVALLPQHQGRGVGTELVKMVLEEGQRRNLPVRLQVLKANRARRLYERLGFEPCGESETHVHMERAGRPAMR
jgi:ribosomal protein S18 acetylase RimI-like enzyme